MMMLLVRKTIAIMMLMIEVMMIIMMMTMTVTITVIKMMDWYVSLLTETMHMILKRHTWYILIINLGIKDICREILYSLLDFHYIWLFPSINCIMDHYSRKGYPWVKYAVPWLNEVCNHIWIINHHHWHTNIHNSIINIQISHMNSHTWFIFLHPGQRLNPCWESMIIGYLEDDHLLKIKCGYLARQIPP